MDWQKIEDDIIERLDVKAEYEKLGVRFSGKERGSGYAECYAYGRNDDVPSAYVHIPTGHYKDAGGGQDHELTLWQFATDAGRFPTWQAARQWFANQVGIQMPGQQGEVQMNQPKCWRCKKDGHWPADCPEKPVERRGTPSLLFVPDPPTDNTAGVRSIVNNWIKQFKKCPIMTMDGLFKAGAVLGQKVLAETGKSVEGVIGWQTYDAAGQVTGAIMVNRGSDKIKVRPGDGEEAYAKCQSIGDCGLAGNLGVWYLTEGYAEKGKPIILSVEGLSDMLASYSMMPKVYDLKPDDPIPVTNKNGASETPTPYLDIFKNAAEVWIIRDCDLAGQKSAELWAYELTKAGIPCRKVLLPFPVSQKHGKDLRDWFGEHHNWEDLKVMCRAVPIYKEPLIVPAVARDNPHQQQDEDAPLPNVPLAEEYGLLERCGITILGKIKDDSGGPPMTCLYLNDTAEMIRIRDFDKLSYNQYIQICGPNFEANIVEKMDPDGVDNRLPISIFKRNVARESRTTLHDEDKIGTGVWPEKKSFILVNGTSIWKYNGKKKLEQIKAPIAGRRLITLKGANDVWFNPDEMSNYIDLANSDPTFREQAMDEVDELFDLWTFKSDEAKHLWQLRRCYVGCIGALLIQECWAWRPIVTITGESRAGKTTLLETSQMVITAMPDFEDNTTDKYQRGCARHFGEPTAASLRQKCNEHSYCMFLDEIEKSPKRQELFDMLRNCSSGGTTIRGTPQGKVQQWRLKLLPFCASIESGVNQIADDNRRIKFEVVKPRSNAIKDFTRVQGNFQHIIQMSAKFKALVIASAERALELAKQLRESPNGLDQRRKDTYSAPVAMYSALRGWTFEQAEDMLIGLINHAEKHIDSDLRSDDIRLIQTILDTHIREAHGQVVTLREFFNKAKDGPWNPTKDEGPLLDRHGFRVTNSRSTRVVCLHPPRLMTMLKGTNFDGMRIKEILDRVPESEYNNAVMYDGTNMKCVKIPLHIFRKLAEPDEPADSLF